MVLDKYRKNIDGFLNKIAKPFMKFSPNTISWLSFIFSIFAGFFLYLGSIYLFLASLMLVLSSLFDAIDGKVARITGRVSKRGDFLDHQLDRYADTVILIGIMFSSYAHWYYAILALTGIYFTSYTGTHALAVTGKRDYGGMMGRADRMVIFIILPILQFFFPLWKFLSITDIALIIIGILGHITAVQRSLRIWRSI